MRALQGSGLSQVRACAIVGQPRRTLHYHGQAKDDSALAERIQTLAQERPRWGWRYSEHGLGHLLNPTDPESDDRSWIAQAWLAIVRRSLGLATKPLGFEKRIAVGRITVSSPAVMKPLKALNEGKPYAKQIKPFNFIISCHVRKLGHPIGVNPERFHLIAPYETDPRKWEAMRWIDQYSKSGKRYRISASAPHGSRTMARVKSYGDVLRQYEYHPEAKCADSSGASCGKQTLGLLGRRHIAIDGFTYIGKESNKLEEVEDQSLFDPSDVYTDIPICGATNGRRSSADPQSHADAGTDKAKRLVAARALHDPSGTAASAGECH